MATGYSLPANRLIPVQFAKMQNGFNSNSVATRTTLDGMENGIKENEKVVFYRCTTFRNMGGRINQSMYIGVQRIILNCLAANMITDKNPVFVYTPIICHRVGMCGNHP